MPLGSELKTNILSKTEANEKVTEALRIAHNFDEILIKDFSESLRYGRHATIDIFLEDNPRYRVLGAHLIAMSIFMRELHENVFPAKDWYDVLFKLVDSDEENDALSNLKIVTLNYDRSLEHFLEKIIEYECREGIRETVRRNRDKIEIVHAHGSLGTYPDVSFGMSIFNHSEIKLAAENIRIVSDDLADAPLFIRAQKIIEKADTVAFLGFGYNERTLDALLDKANTDAKKMIGTSYGINESTKSLLRNRFGEEFLSDPGQKCDSVITSLLEVA